MFQKQYPSVILESSTRKDGNMSFRYDKHDVVVANRKRFFNKLGLDADKAVCMGLEHKSNVLVVDTSHQGAGMNDRATAVIAETLLTQSTNVPLFLLTADCFPVAFFDIKKNVIGLAHLGWKSISLLLCKKVIDEMKEVFRTDPKHILVHIGPGIHKDSYIKYRPELQNNPLWQPFLEETVGSATKIDLIGYNLRQLIESGIRDENITIDEHDTATSGDYFSHYRSVLEHTPEQRFATVIALI